MAVSTPARPPAAATRAYRGPYAALVNKAARRNGLDPFLLAGLLKTESGFHPNARSSTGDYGIAQINLAAHPQITAAEAGSPAFAIPWAARYLAELKRSAGGSVTGALRAYNTGRPGVSAPGNAYASRVLAARNTLRSSGPAAAPAGYVDPVPGGTVTQLDQGIDYQGKPGGAVVAVGNARIDAVKPDPGGFGQAIYYTLTSGPKKGQQLYAGEALPTVRPGQQVKAGQRIATLVARLPGANVTGPDVTEVGLASGGAPAYASGSQGGQALTGFLAGARPAPAGGGGGGVLGGLRAAASVLTFGIYNPNAGTGAPNPATLTARNVPGLTTAGEIASLSGTFLTDPGYPFIWLGFFLVGIAFVFLGVERLLGRSAGQDVGNAARGVAVVAAPEAAPLQVAG